MEEYLIDESLIVYLEREDYQYHEQLVRFLDDAGIKNVKRKYRIFMTKIARDRLGARKIYKAITWYKRLSGKPSKIINPLEKARMRADICIPLVEKYIAFPLSNSLFKGRELTNLFIYSNNSKSEYVQKSHDLKITPEEVISFDVCKTAIIARKQKLKIISFNSDYKYLTMIPGINHAFIVHIHPDDLLREYT